MLLLDSILVIDWFDYWIDLNPQISLNYNLSNLAILCSVMFIQLYLKVSEWMNY